MVAAMAELEAWDASARAAEDYDTEVARRELEAEHQRVRTDLAAAWGPGSRGPGRQPRPAHGLPLWRLCAPLDLWGNPMMPLKRSIVVALRCPHPRVRGDAGMGDLRHSVSGGSSHLVGTAAHRATESGHTDRESGAGTSGNGGGTSNGDRPAHAGSRDGPGTDRRDSVADPRHDRRPIDSTRQRARVAERFHDRQGGGNGSDDE